MRARACSHVRCSHAISHDICFLESVKALWEAERAPAVSTRKARGHATARATHRSMRRSLRLRSAVASMAALTKRRSAAREKK